MTKSTNLHKKIWLFRTILIFIPIAFVILLELGLRIFGYGPNLALFIDHPDFKKFYRINPQLGLRYFPSLRVQPEVSYDVLLKEKPENGFRVFVLGGSSAFGYPYAKNAAFSSFLKSRLKDFLPHREVEVVNLAMCAVGSYTVRDIGMELFSYEPDAILIYSGHNEFYGALGVGSSEFIGKSRKLVNFYLKLRRYKTFLLVRDFVLKVRASITHPQQKHARLMEHMAREKLISENSELYRKALEIYQQNLYDLVNEAQRRKVPIFLGELVSNWKDQPPFESIFADSNQKINYEKAVQLFNENKYHEALNLLDSLIEKECNAADVFYLKARCFIQIGNADSAKRYYLQAKDKDALRFRAPETFNFVLQMLSRQTQARLVPLKAVFQSNSSNGIIGNELMIDHLHPNVKGYFLMGKAYFEALRTNYPWKKNEDFGEVRTDSLYWDNGGITELDLQEGLLRIKILKSNWPFNSKEARAAILNIDKRDVVKSLAIDVINDKISWEQAHVKLAGFYIKQKKFDSAIAEFFSLLKATPYNVSPYLEIGKIYMHLRQFKPAARFFIKSLEIEKTLFGCQGAGEALLHLGEPASGITYLKSAYQMDEKNPLTLYLLAKSYFKAGDIVSAKTWTEKLATTAPAFPGLREMQRLLEN